MEIRKNRPWLFFGLGNILFAEDNAFAQFYLLVYRILENKDDSLTFERLMQQRDELIKEGHSYPIQTIMQRHLSEEEIRAVRTELKKRIGDDWLKYNPLLPQTIPLLKQLQQNYNLGVIANAPSYIRKVLDDVALTPFFDLMIFSREIGFPKPSKRIYQAAVNGACELIKQESVKAIMVGDSLENDIEPANQVGFLSIQLLWELQKKYSELPMPEDEHIKIYMEHQAINSSHKRKAQNSEQVPDFQISNFDELEQLLNSEKVKEKLVSLAAIT